MALLRRKSSSQFELPLLLGDQRWPGPREIFLPAEDVPNDDGQLACGRNGGDLVTPLGANAQEEGPQRSGGVRSRPGRFNEHPARMSAADLADMAVLCRLQARLPDSWVQPEVADQLLGRSKPGDIADRDQSVLSYVRRSRSDYLIVLLNLTAVPRPNYRFGALEDRPYTTLLNSDAIAYGGSGFSTSTRFATEAVAWHQRPQSFTIDLPPLAAVVLAPE